MDLGLHVLGDWDSPVMPIMVYHLCYISGISRRCLEVRRAHVCVCVCGGCVALELCRAGSRTAAPRRNGLACGHCTRPVASRAPPRRRL
jgi:hypothetical protein